MASAECSVRGETIKVVAPSARDFGVISAAVPPPPVPTNNYRGVSTPNDRDPGYLALRFEREQIVHGAMLAAAMSLGGTPIEGVQPFEAVRPLPATQAGEWCKQANNALRSLLTLDELNTIALAVDRASSGAMELAAEELYRPIGADEKAEPPKPIPDARVETEAMLKLRVCARFGISPRDIDAYTHGEIATLIQADQVMREEDRAMLAAVAFPMPR